MAETKDGEYYYDAGTINEQLDEYEVYEQDGSLYFNKEGADPEAHVRVDGVADILGGTRDEPVEGEFKNEEHIVYVNATSGDVEIARLANPGNDVGNQGPVEVATLALTGDFA